MEYVFLIAALLGGLALFIFGMGLMTEGLRQASGTGLRTVLARAGRSPLLGILLGTGFVLYGYHQGFGEPERPKARDRYNRYPDQRMHP